MNDAQKRQFVSDLYSGPVWKRRVEKMGDDQVAAIYLDYQRDLDLGPKPQTYYESVEWEALIPKLDSLTGPRPPHHNEDDFHTY